MISSGPAIARARLIPQTIDTDAMTSVSRNSPCPCGSGKRYKFCCGGEATVAVGAVAPQADASRGGAPPQAELRGTMYAALAQQQRGEHAAAEALYRQALAIQPDQPDCLHMLGVVCHELGRDHEAYALVLRALDVTGWQIEPMRVNLCLIIVRLLAPTEAAAVAPVSARYAALLRERAARNVEGEPLVSIVVRAHDARSSIGRALDSVRRQTYRRIEVIVIDDGSTDGTVEAIRASLDGFPFPHRFVARAHRGAAASINEGVALASGEFVNALDADGAFPPDRIAVMVDAVARRGAEWGFGGVVPIDAAGNEIDTLSHRQAFDLLLALDRVSRWPTLGAAFLASNPAVTAGNVFARKSLFETLGGLRDFQYGAAWDFCLRATLAAEPVLVDRETYHHCLPGDGTATALRGVESAGDEAIRMFGEFFTRTICGDPPANEFAPTGHAWGPLALLWAARTGRSVLVGADALRRLTERIDFNAATGADAGDLAAAAEPVVALESSPAGRRLDALAATLPTRPLVSILLPVYDTPPRWLHRCIRSVLAQTYRDWELCVADDASPHAHVREIVADYARHDPRIRFVVRERNGHISASTNSALALATGEWCALLDHDDELSRDALFWVAREIGQHPGAVLVYSDEDKIDEAGFRFGAYLKPDWNPELLRGQNCISHLGAYRTDAVRAAGGFRIGLEGAQDWDLALRITERAGPDQVRHVPRVLYHWRMIPGSTARTIAHKSYASDAQRRVLDEHLQRTGAVGNVNPVGDFWRIAYAPDASPPPRVSLIVDARGPAADAWRELLLPLLAETRYTDLTVVACIDESAAAPILPVFPAVRALTCLTSETAGSAYRRAAALCSGAVIGLVAHPCRPTDGDWLALLVGFARREANGAVAPKLVTPDGRIAFAGSLLGFGDGVVSPYVGQPQDTPGQSGRARLAQNFAALAGGVLLVEARKLDAAGGFRPIDASPTAAQIAVCLALRDRGWWNVFVPAAVLSTARPPVPALAADERAELERRWPRAFAADPAYHPALSRERLFELA